MDEAIRHDCFFQNRPCEYFPCHKGIPEEAFNCLFCYCPLYTLGKKCGGNFLYTDRGIKSCENCTFPQWRENYEKILARYGDLMDVVKRMDREGKQEDERTPDARKTD